MHESKNIIICVLYKNQNGLKKYFPLKKFKSTLSLTIVNEELNCYELTGTFFEKGYLSISLSI